MQWECESLIAFKPGSSRSSNCLDIKVMFDMFMTTTLLQEDVIQLLQQGLADADSALQLTTPYCSALMFSSAHPVVGRHHDNETGSSTHQHIGRGRSVSPLLFRSWYGLVPGLVSHPRLSRQQRRDAGEIL
jgi:hypothetical protein